MTKHALDQEKRFSESRLWKLQEEAYTSFGMAAWESEGVPFYLTSNPFSAAQAAGLAIAHLEDCFNNGSYNADETLYLFDLGAGTGRFAYLFLKEWIPLAKDLIGDGFCYVMTDIVEDNLQFLKSHPYFKEWIEEGIVDVAYYHHAQKSPIVLQIANKTIKESGNPCLLFANYFFDTIPQDYFRVKEGDLEEGLVTLYYEGEEEVLSEVIKKLQCSYRYVPVKAKGRFPDVPGADALLDSYRRDFNGSSFLFPTGALQVIDFFKNFSRGSFFLRAADQGVVSDLQVRGWGEPRIDKHGTFSIGVSYHALARFLGFEGAVVLMEGDPDPLFITMAAAAGQEDNHVLLREYHLLVSDFDPKDYWYLTEGLIKAGQREGLPLKDLCLLIKFGRGDPMTFYAIYHQILGALTSATQSEKESLADLLLIVAENHYPLNAAEGEFLHNIAVLLFQLRRYTPALHYFELSMLFTGENSRTLKNITACRGMLS